MDGIAEHKEEHGIKEGETNPEFNLADPRKQLERGLKSRHIQFLALGTMLNSLLLRFATNIIQVVLLEQVSSWDLGASSQKQALHLYSWDISL
jgi:hypothetical protein